MSHLIQSRTTKFHRSAIPAMLAAAESFGITVEENGLVTYYLGLVQRCPWALKTPGHTYDIGIVPVQGEEDMFTLTTDWYMGGNGLESLVGTDFGKLKAKFAEELVTMEAGLQGFGEVTTTVDGDWTVMEIEI
jgi:hypothetical protein